MSNHRTCDAVIFNRGPQKCEKVIEDGAGATVTIETAKIKEIYDLCDACFRKFYRVINPTGIAQAQVTVKNTGS